MKILGREPALVIAVVSSLVVFAGTLGFGWLDGKQAALFVTAIKALAGAATAWAVRPIAPAAFTGALSALIALGAAYGLNATPEQIGALNLVVEPMLALLTRGQVSPVETSATNASLEPTPEAAAHESRSAARRRLRPS